MPKTGLVAGAASGTSPCKVESSYKTPSLNLQGGTETSTHATSLIGIGISGE